MTIDQDAAVARMVIWQKAEEIVKPLIEQHPLEKYSSGQPLVNTITITPLDQHMDAIERVANWLIGDG